MEAFVPNERHDRDAASNRRSRFEAYLNLNVDRFLDYDREPTTNADEFALAAFLIALPPVMAPGYVGTDARVLDVVAHWDGEDRPALSVSLVSALPSSPASLAGSRWSSWRRDGYGSSRLWVEHVGNDRVVLLPTLTVRMPLSSVVLPTPVYCGGLPDVEVAKVAVASVCTGLNRALAPVLAMLDVAGVSA